MIVLIDNYDSFSYNLYQLIGSVEPDVKVVRNDAYTVEEIEAKIPAMAADAMKSGNIAVNPRASRQCDIEMLYKQAL